MQVVKYKSLELVVNLNVPSTVSEFDTNAKKEGAALTEAINNVVYRSSLAEFRSTLIHGREADEEKGISAVVGLEDRYEFPRKTKETSKKDKDGNAVLAFDETEGDYVDRLLASKGLKVEDLQPLADEITASIVFDASATERKTPISKKLAAKYLDGGKVLVVNDTKRTEFLKRYHKLLAKELVLAEDTSKHAEQLGWAIKEFVDENERQSIAKITG